jgi:hypothetical protein
MGFCHPMGTFFQPADLPDNSQLIAALRAAQAEDQDAMPRLLAVV